MGAVAEQPREMLLGDLIAIREHRALAGVQSRETGAEPGALRAARLGVLAGQGGAHVAVAVARDHRFEQILVAATGRHHADRHHHGAPFPSRSRGGPPQRQGARSAPDSTLGANSVGGSERAE